MMNSSQSFDTLEFDHNTVFAYQVHLVTAIEPGMTETFLISQPSFLSVSLYLRGERAAAERAGAQRTQPVPGPQVL